MTEPGGLRTLDVLVVAGSSDPGSVEATLRSLSASEIVRRRMGRVYVVGAEPPPSGAQLPFAVTRLELTDGRLPDGIDRPKAGHWVVLRAGDELHERAIRALFDTVRRRTAPALFGLRPDGQGHGAEYVLYRALGERTRIAMERDPALLWVGTTGLVLRHGLVTSCRHYDLTGAVGIGSLFVEALSIAGACQLLPDAVRAGTPLEDALTVEHELYDPSWYVGLNDFFHPFAADVVSRLGALPVYLQRVYLYLLHTRMRYNRHASNKFADRAALDGFLADCGEVLRLVRDDVLVGDVPGAVGGTGTRTFLLGLKGSSVQLDHRYYRDDVALCVGDQTVASAAATLLEIEILDVAKDRLRVSARYLFPIDGTDLRIALVHDGRRYRGKETERFADVRVFDRTTQRAVTVEFDVGLSREATPLHFELVSPSKHTRVVLGLRFTRPASRLTNDPGSYWRCGKYVFVARNREIGVEPSSRARVRELERERLKAMRASDDPDAPAAVRLRLLYFATRPWFRRKRIWIYFDKVYKGGDNGEYAYRYARKRRDRVEKHYVLRGDAVDVERFRTERIPFLEYGTIRQKLLYLNAELVFSTHINPQNFVGFGAGADHWIRDLTRYRMVAIQHGLSVQNLSDTINRVVDDTAMYCVASPVETENLLRPEYDYRPEQIVPTGLARYDGLIGEPEREVVIALTWRSYLATPWTIVSAREYSSSFRDSTYRRIVDDIVNDERLLAAARKHGYRVTLLVHPLLSAQADDFNAPAGVDVVPTTGDVSYEAVLTRAALLVTDYSGIQFDMAYQRKPVVYFHPPELPASYDEGAYSYATMALGDIATTVDGLAEVVAGYLARGCALDPEYADRIERFFHFHDRDNAKRIYEVGRALTR